MPNKPKASDYKYIRAWGKFLGSYEYYIVGEQERALEDDAPFDAISYDDQNKRWRTVRDIKRPGLKAQLDDLLTRLK
jgi:hypothetical protein